MLSGYKQLENRSQKGIRIYSQSPEDAFPFARRGNQQLPQVTFVLNDSAVQSTTKKYKGHNEYIRPTLTELERKLPNVTTRPVRANKRERERHIFRSWTSYCVKRSPNHKQMSRTNNDKKGAKTRNQRDKSKVDTKLPDKQKTGCLEKGKLG